MFFRHLLALLFVIASMAAIGQDTRREDSIPGSLLRSIHYAAEESSLADFPDLRDSEKGTIVSVHNSFHDSDVIITTGKKEYPQKKLEEIAHKIATEIGKPKTDFIVATGQRLQYVDLEMNDYLTKDRWTSKTSIEIGKILNAVNESDLPRPIGFAIKIEGDPEIRFRGELVSKTSIFPTKDVKDSEVIDVKVVRHWYGITVAILLLGLLIFACLGMPIFLIRHTLKEKKPEEESSEEEPKSLAEIQQKYLDQPKEKFRFLALVFPIIMIVFMMFGRSAVKDMTSWIPESFQPKYMFLMFIPMAVTLPAIAVIRKRKGIVEDERVKRTMRPMRYLMIPFGMMMVFMAILMLKPAWLRSLPKGYAVNIYWILVLGSVGLAGLLVFRDRRKSRTRLGPGDSDYEAAVEFSKNAKVHLGRVEINRDFVGVNAAASLFGRVFVTEGLREKLSPEERRAIIAHEIGHLKGQHAPIFMLIGLAFTGLISFLLIRSTDASENWPQWAKDILATPFIFLIPQTLVSLFVISPIRRRAEFYADRFALEQTKDYSLIATALTKVHLFNQSPHTLKPGSERIASHPSLTKRLDSLRKVAGELGLVVDDTEVDKLFNGPMPSEEEA